MVNNIIGIGGKLASGKDAISDHLVAEHGWVKLGMSDALSEALYILNPWIPTGIGLDQKKGFAKLVTWLNNPFGTKTEFTAVSRYQELFDRDGYVEVKKNSEVRRLLQILGTEVGRKIIGESTWTDIVIRRTQDALAEGAPGVIITGIRFPNELDMIEDLDGELWWVDRPSLQAGSNAGHASENSVSSVDFDRVVVNDGTLEDLYQKVDDLVK
ncbi:deoxynucleoside monophosphate kinase [Microbacterium phage Zooman]|nr:deoxynucleoside monophosphate kinase [Microbacterium phage Zooman]